MKKLFDDTKYILSLCDGIHERLKEIHWSTKVKSEHLLTDDIDSAILGYQDRLAEVAMGLSGKRYGSGDLKALLPDAKDLMGVLKETENEIKSYKEKCKESAIDNICDDFLEDLNKWKYLSTFS